MFEVRGHGRQGGIRLDGIFFVYPVEEAIRVRTGERGQEAMMYPCDIDSKKAG